MHQPTIDRRSFMAMAAALALPVPKSRRLAFQVFRNGTKVGEQTLHFIDAGNVLTVDNHVELKVALLTIPVFHYTAHIVEHWTDDQFRSATSTINDNGTPHQLFVERQAAGVMIEGNRTPQYHAPANALPLTYWNKAILKGPIINMQTGKSAVPAITKRGWFKLAAAPAGSVTAEDYQLVSRISIGKQPLSVYYDRETWSGLAFDHEGHIAYRPVIG